MEYDVEIKPGDEELLLAWQEFLKSHDFETKIVKVYNLGSRVSLGTRYALIGSPVAEAWVSNEGFDECLKFERNFLRHRINRIKNQRD